MRDAQAALTRERILMAAKDYLEKNDIETLTLRHLAELAGVSAPTVYSHFATIDDLVTAFFQWLKPRLGLQKPLPDLDHFAELPADLFGHYEEYGALLRNLMNRPAWDRQRHADSGKRHGPWVDAVGTALPKLTPDQRRRGAMVASAFWTPTVWRWLRDTCGFTPKEAEQVAGWAVAALVKALKDDPSGLAGRVRDIGVRGKLLEGVKS
ncbi:TetR/AcrR family transcriptional regulator [Enhydrobacter aerosaccus]|uniref:TetR/AcrR family transcriptional regulator n=1 Tax=Enhydrobacter aerosaccus TaxID=225324 RepID=UPI001C45DB0C|nr:TetR/AcrR family transcriptional regulator [Enhydrobacter aerosaccus]